MNSGLHPFSKTEFQIKSSEEKNVLDEKSKLPSKIFAKTHTHVYNNCFKLSSRASKQKFENLSAFSHPSVKITIFITPSFIAP